jgi:hypothetical protein
VFGLLSLMLLFFSARWESVAVFWFLLVLPGYVLSRVLLQEELFRALVAFPLSIFLLGAVTGIGGWLTPHVIDWPSVAVVWILVLLARAWHPPQMHLSFSSEESAIAPAAAWKWAGFLALAIGIGFFTYAIILADASFSSKVPGQINSYDKVVQVSWVTAASETGNAILPPAFHQGEVDVQTSLLPPMSVWPVAMWARFSGMSAWDAQHAFAGMVHAITIGLVFWLIWYVFGSLRLAGVSSLVLALPYMPFLVGDLGGMYRVSMVVLLVPLLWLGFEWMLERKPHAHIWMAIWVSALMLTHPVSFVVMLVPLLFLVYSSLLQKKDFLSMKGYFLLPLAAGIFFLLVHGWPILSGVDRVLDAHNFWGSTEWVNPLAFDAQLSALVGPILFLRYYGVHLLLASIICAWILFRAWKKTPATPSRWTRVAVMVLFLGIITLGLNSFYYAYLPKLRSALFFVFLIPMLLFGAHLLVEKRLARFHGWLPLVVVFLVGIFFISSVFGPNLEINAKVDSITWQAIQQVQTNTSSHASVLAVFGFYQHAHLLTGRYGDYFSSKNELLLALSGTSKGLGPYCLPGYRRKGLLEIIPAPCTKKFSSLGDYDYLLADFGVINKDAKQTQYYSQQLEEIGFVPVFVNSDVAVYKNLHISPAANP